MPFYLYLCDILLFAPSTPPISDAKHHITKWNKVLYVSAPLSVIREISKTITLYPIPTEIPIIIPLISVLNDIKNDVAMQATATLIVANNVLNCSPFPVKFIITANMIIDATPKISPIIPLIIKSKYFDFSLNLIFFFKKIPPEH